MPWVISHVPIFHITQPLGIWSTRWLLFLVMSNIPKSWDIYQPLDAAGACIYLSVVVVQTWNASVHRTWQHYARKERERAELMDFIRQVGSGSTMDQPWIKDGSKWWIKKTSNMLMSYVDIVYGRRLWLYLLWIIVGNMLMFFFFFRHVICPWLLHLHDWADTLCCISFTVCSIISYHHSYHFGWPTWHKPWVIPGHVRFQVLWCFMCEDGCGDFFY